MKKKKGIVGIEAAIVLIAFVIVAAALAFVVLNMGFFTTQKSKEVMAAGLEEATSALEIDGTVFAHVTNKKVDRVIIPLKLAQGREPIDFVKTKMTVSVILKSPSGAKTAFANAYYGIEKVTITDLDNAAPTVSATTKVNATAYYVVGDADDTVLESGEKVIMVVALDSSVALSEYSEIIVEIRPTQGAPLTFEATIPPELDTAYIILQ